MKAEAHRQSIVEFECVGQAALADLISNPESHFSDPMEVTQAHGLSHEEKCAALDNWEQNARALAVASEEGMTGGEPTQISDVLEAKNELGVPVLERKGPTKAF